MVDFWFNHFNVFAGKGQARTYLHRVRARRDPSARPRQVPRSPQATAESPAMLFYLDNWQSTAPEAHRDHGAESARRDAAVAAAQAADRQGP